MEKTPRLLPERKDPETTYHESLRYRAAVSGAYLVSFLTVSILGVIIYPKMALTDVFWAISFFLAGLIGGHVMLLWQD